MLPTSMFPFAFPSRPHGRQRRRLPAEPRAQGTPVSRHSPALGTHSAAEKSSCCAAGQSWLLWSTEIPSRPLAKEDGTRWQGRSAQRCSHTAAWREESTLLETGVVRLGGFGEYVLQLFKNVIKCPGFIWLLLQLGCTKPGSPAGVPLAPLTIVCRDMSGSSGCRTPEGLSSASPPLASCSISLLLHLFC